MYGSVPAVFKDIEAAIFAARAYAIETGFDYGVYVKNRWDGKPFYRPVAANDEKEAEKDGYEIAVSPTCLRGKEN